MPNDSAPGLVLYAAEMTDDIDWNLLSGHACNGFKLDYLSGFVKVLQPSVSGLTIISKIADEDFCKSCDRQNLDWDITPQHREAYCAFLASLGLEPGDMTMLKQAVYPLMATQANLDILGISGLSIPAGSVILVLGWNCD